MTRKSLEHLNCSWAQAAEAIGDKWSLMIVRDAFYGVRTFSAFANRIGIAKNILTQRLKHLEDHGIIEKRSMGVGSTRFEYCLSEKGLSLFPVLIAMSQWSDKWVFGPGNEPLIVVDAKNKQPIQPVQVNDAQGQPLSIEEVEFVDGPGAVNNTLNL